MTAEGIRWTRARQARARLMGGPAFKADIEPTVDSEADGPEIGRAYFSLGRSIVVRKCSVEFYLGAERVYRIERTGDAIERGARWLATGEPPVNEATD